MYKTVQYGGFCFWQKNCSMGLQISWISRLALRRLLMIRRLMALLLVVCFYPTMSYANYQMYVSMNNDTIVTYDISPGSSSAIAASAKTFANTNLSLPNGLVFDSSGNLYAANGGTNTISKFNSSGVFQSSIGQGSLSGPTTGLLFDTSGNLYVSDYFGNKITKFNSSGVFQFSFGSSANLDLPNGLAFDNSSNIFVANGRMNSIAKFDSLGVFQTSFGSSANLSRPGGVVIDNLGNLYTANYDSSTISKFNSSGVFQSFLGSGFLNKPNGLAFDSLGNLYVANDGSKTISKFGPAGNFLLSWNTVSNPRFIVFAPAPVPEPSSFVLLGFAILAAGCGKRFSRFCKI